MARKLKPCGTVAAYRRHLKAGETPCEPCREANRQLQRDAKEKKQRAKEEEFRAVVDEVRSSGESFNSDDASRVSDLKRQRRLVLAALEGASSIVDVRSIPSLSRELREINRELEELEGTGEETGGGLSEFINADVGLAPVAELHRA